MNKRHFTAFSALLVPAAMLGTAPANAVLLVELQFNETGTTAVNNGSLPDANMIGWGPSQTNYGVANGQAMDLHSADGLGVSGLPGDRAFDNTASQPRPVANLGGDTLYTGGVVHNNLDPGSLTNFTVSGWFKTESGSWGEQEVAPGQASGAVSLWAYFDDGDNNFQLYNNNYGTPNDADFYTEDGGTGVHYFAGEDIWAEAGEWQFFAISHDGNNGVVNFYAGTIDSPVTLVATVNGAPANVSGGGHWTWGNDRNMINAFDGYMDNLRVHDDEMLDAAALEALRLGDGGIVPEPASLALLGLAGGVLALRRRQA